MEKKLGRRGKTYRRSVELCAGVEPRSFAQAGTTHLWAFGYRSLSILFDVSERTVRAWVAEGKLDPKVLPEIVELVQQRKRQDSLWERYQKKLQEALAKLPKDVNVFVAEPTEVVAGREWYDQHLKDNHPTKKDQAKLGELMWCFAPTHLGQYVEVRCSCGATKNVTDYDLW